MEKNYFDTPFQEFIFTRTYAKWIEELNRRERWDETINRFSDFMVKRIPNEKDKEYFLNNIMKDVLEGKEAPSMRAIWTAGKALERENICAYNCSGVVIDDPAAFSEILYILMCGTGSGFSVESIFTDKMPVVPKILKEVDDVIVFKDSKLGWAEGYAKFIRELYKGKIFKYDTSKIRKKGARLKTFGGRACLTGDTILYKDRKKPRNQNEITIKDLYDLERSQGKWEHKPNHFKRVKIRSLDEETGSFYRNNVITVVDNGIAPVYEIITENGYRIKATKNHRFMNAAGNYDFLENFNVGDLIAVNGSSEKKTGTCIDCGCAISRRAVRCKPCYDKFQIKPNCSKTTARQRKENKDYRSLMKNKGCELCGIAETDKRFEIHHIDKNPYNNNHDNLQWLCPKCHQGLHAIERTFSDPYKHRYLSFDKIVSIEYVGDERVYDLQMKAPNHNFIANGFVSHNSGPEPLIKLLEITKSIFKKRTGQKLDTISCYDLVCFIASIVVVGGTRRCLPIDAEIATSKGIKKINDVEIGDYVVTGGSFYKILDKEYTGKKKVININHNFGKITCTPEHRVAIFSDDDPMNYIFKQAKDIKLGDCLVWDAIGINGRDTYIDGLEIDEDVAWAFGIVQNLGYSENDNDDVTISVKEKDKKIIEELNRIFEYNEFEIVEYNREKCYITVKTPEFIEYINDNTHIPDFIKEASTYVRYSYIASLFDVGKIIGDKNDRMIIKGNVKFFKDMEQLFFSVGIAMNTFNSIIVEYCNKDYYSITVSGITNRKNLIKNVLHYCVNNDLAFTSFINKFVTEEKVDFKYKSKIFGKNDGYITLDEAIENNLVEENITYYPLPVTLIETNGITETVDIEVEYIKQFTTNGVVVHNSATISLSDLNDDKMRHAKDGNYFLQNPQRALANNSIAYKEKPDCITFMKEWETMIRSKTGERGIFNRGGIHKHLKKHVSRRNNSFNFITNPCVPYDTLILTDNGYKKIGDCVGRKINIWNGKEFSEVEPFYTGNKKLYEIKLSNGVSLKCTGNHKWVLWDGKEYRKETIDLKTGEKLAKFNMPIIDNDKVYDVDAYSQGFYTGDGTENNIRSWIWIYKPKYCCESRLIGEIKKDGDGSKNRHTWIHGNMKNKSFVPIDGSIEYCLNWFAGYVDANGYIKKYDKSYDLQITSINLNQLKEIRLMLNRLGCDPKINQCSKEQMDGNEYLTKNVYRLCLNAQDLYTLYKLGLRTNRLKLNDNKPQRDARHFVTIESITDLNKSDDVYCFNEPLNHTGTFNGIVTGQCGEVILRPKQFCNLSEVIVRHDDTLEDLKEKVKHATILGCIQTTLSNFKFLRKEWRDNVEEERLLGVSMTGLRDHPILNHVHNTAKYWLEELKDHSIQTSKIWANKLGINEPTAVTCLKPSGCTTLDTKIKTSDGVLSMNDIFTKNNVIFDDYKDKSWIDPIIDIKVLDENNDYKKITKLFINGTEDVYDIEFTDGKVYTFTGNHKLKTLNGFKRVDELDETDEIISF